MQEKSVGPGPGQPELTRDKLSTFDSVFVPVGIPIAVMWLLSQSPPLGITELVVGAVYAGIRIYKSVIPPRG